MDGNTGGAPGAGSGRHRAPEPVPPPVQPPPVLPPPVRPPPVRPAAEVREERRQPSGSRPGRWLAWMLAGFLVVGGGLVAGYAALGDPAAPGAGAGTSGPPRSPEPSPTDGDSTAPGTIPSDLPAPVVPACDGSFVLIVGSVTTPIGYQDAVSRLLDATPGAHWFTTEGSCGSLRDRSDAGTLIHTVYLGPFPTAEAALASCGAGPADAYVKRLDDGTGGDGVVSCG
ncbi:hypothetical protein [Blastococcus sp. URHD0036]|uniref:hypothetical protein n=1 Tax=Blastococcus sp. URHD0036 TaxID=1380356 RepID=UPI0006916FEC|nr:hypothetical protein [Blastococcus sp. URHD0036]